MSLDVRDATWGLVKHELSRFVEDDVDFSFDGVPIDGDVSLRKFVDDLIHNIESGRRDNADVSVRLTKKDKRLKAVRN